MLKKGNILLKAKFNFRGSLEDPIRERCESFYVEKGKIIRVTLEKAKMLMKTGSFELVHPFSEIFPENKTYEQKYSELRKWAKSVSKLLFKCTINEHNRKETEEPYDTEEVVEIADGLLEDYKNLIRDHDED